MSQADRSAVFRETKATAQYPGDKPLLYAQSDVSIQQDPRETGQKHA